MEIRKINRRTIYSYIYEQKSTSKQKIVEALRLSLSTVTHNLQLLESEGLVQRTGTFESTGGRRARRIGIVPDVKISLGIGILKEKVHLALVDLFGNVIKNKSVELDFSMNEEYSKKLGELAASFLGEYAGAEEKLLGAGIAIQGIISKDGKNVGYGRILQNENLRLETLAGYLPCKSLLFHDSKAAAWAELWYRKDLKDAVVLLLNNNLGGALILDRKIHEGKNMYGGLVEHMSLSPDGPICYCGSRGCLETYLSADSLKKRAAADLDAFFAKLRNGDGESAILWEEYLKNLSFAIRNLQVLMDSDVIISGLLNNYMLPEDFDRLRFLVKQEAPFPEQKNRLIAGRHGALSPAIGSALFFIDDWLEQI